MWFRILVVILIFPIIIPVTPRAYKWNSRSLKAPPDEKEKYLAGDGDNNYLRKTRPNTNSGTLLQKNLHELQVKKLRKRHKRAVEDQVFPPFDEVERINKVIKISDAADEFGKVPLPTKPVPHPTPTIHASTPHPTTAIHTTTTTPAPTTTTRTTTTTPPTTTIQTTTTTPTIRILNFPTEKAFREEVNRVFEANTVNQPEHEFEFPEDIPPRPPKSFRYQDFPEEVPIEVRAGDIPLRQLRIPDERTDYYGPRKQDLSKGPNSIKNPDDCYIPGEDAGVLVYKFEPKPPCRGLEQTPIGLEPIPYIYYNGTLEHEEECWLNGIINDAQLIGISTTPSPGNPIDGPLNLKRELIESGTCRVDLGLECVRVGGVIDFTPAPDAPPIIKDREIYGKCQCMNAFGGHARKRVVITVNGTKKCYIPAELGYHSECKSKPKGANYPLPSGDPVYESELWNKVNLPCVPNAKCVEHYNWYERRCVCLKGYKKNKEDGTCGRGVNLEPKMYTFIVSLTLLIYLMK